MVSIDRLIDMIDMTPTKAFWIFKCHSQFLRVYGGSKMKKFENWPTRP